MSLEDVRWQVWVSGSDAPFDPPDKGSQEGRGERSYVSALIRQGYVNVTRGNDPDIFVGEDPWAEVKELSEKNGDLRFPANEDIHYFTYNSLFVPRREVAREIFSDWDFFLFEGRRYITTNNLRRLLVEVPYDEKEYFEMFFSTTKVKNLVLTSKLGYVELDREALPEVASINRVDRLTCKVKIDIEKLARRTHGFHDNKGDKGMAQQKGEPVLERPVRIEVGGIDTDDLDQPATADGREGLLGGGLARTSAEEIAAAGGIGGVHLF